jgi:hydrogenase/urease accessory protein HupE
MSGLCALLLLAAIAVGAGSAGAHQMNLTNARIVLLPDRQVAVDLAIKGSDVDKVVGTAIFDDATGLVNPDAVAAAARSIAAYVEQHASVIGKDATRCRPTPVAVLPDEDGVVIRTRWSCGEVGDPLVYRSTVLTEAYADARQVVLIGSGAGAAQSLLDAAQTDVALTEPEGFVGVVRRYVSAGIEHIFLGYDHIAFLVAIMLWARRLLPVVKIVTAFTVAHSVTLSLAALDIVRIPGAVVEPAIAASIVYVALENYVSRDVDRRWRNTFVFGLVHGFGFAGALQEYGLPGDALIPALASFNIGVEIGQIAIVSLVMPVLLLGDRLLGHRGTLRPRRAAATVYALSGVIGALGAYWFLVRTILPEPAWSRLLGS